MQVISQALVCWLGSGFVGLSKTPLGNLMAFEPFPCSPYPTVTQLVGINGSDHIVAKRFACITCIINLVPIRAPLLAGILEGKNVGTPTPIRTFQIW